MQLKVIASPDRGRGVAIPSFAHESGIASSRGSSPVCRQAGNDGLRVLFYNLIDTLYIRIKR